MLKLFNKTNNLHFIGIGGIGMSGMAELLFNYGFKISGSDISISDRTNHLKKLGINIYHIHNKENIKNCDVIIYSSAVDFNNVEITEGIKQNIPIIKRSELLGEIIKVKKISIAVAGTHGKTSTSSMLGNILHEAKLDPTLIIGGIINKFNSNNISGTGDMIVVEADEFDKSFLSLRPTYSIINNLDLEHLDCYENLESLQKTFVEFANFVPFYGKVFINNDSDNLTELNQKINKPKVTFGIINKSDVQAKNISYSKNKSKFFIYTKEINNTYINLKCPGIHNVYNALAATCVALELNIPIDIIKNGLEKYSGVKRRFDIKYNNSINGIMVIDDYAHHPSEIEVTINAAKNGWGKRIIAIFQPHLYSRTKDFFKEFSKSLLLADIIILSDIYGAREKPIKGVTNNLIMDALIKQNHTNVQCINNMNKIPGFINKIVKNNDIILCMGAGNINSIINEIINNINDN